MITSTLPQPKIYELNPESEKYYDAVMHYASIAENLNEGLTDLLADTRRADIKPNVIEIKKGDERDLDCTYGVDDGPISKLYGYDTLGFVIINYYCTLHLGGGGYASSNFELKEFPSSRGRLLTQRIEKLMAELGFEEPENVDPSSFEQL